MKKLHHHLKSAVATTRPDKERIRRSVKTGAVDILIEPKPERRASPLVRAVASFVAVCLVFTGILTGASLLNKFTSSPQDLSGVQTDGGGSTGDVSITTVPQEPLSPETSTTWEEIRQGILEGQIVVSDGVDIEILAESEKENVTTQYFYDKTGYQIFKETYRTYGIYYYDGEGFYTVSSDYLVDTPVPLQHGELNGMLFRSGFGFGIVHDFFTYYDFTTQTSVVLAAFTGEDSVEPSEHGLPLQIMPLALQLDPMFRPNGDVFLNLYVNSGPIGSDSLTLTYRGAFCYRAETNTWSYWQTIPPEWLEPTDPDTTVEEDHTSDTTEPPPSWELPEADLEGYTFGISVSSETKGDLFFAPSEEDPTFIDSQIYHRNARLEQTYGITIAPVVYEEEVHAERILEAVFAADANFDLSSLAVDRVSSLLSVSYALVDWNTVEGLQLDASYWAQSLNRSLTVDGHLYTAVGAMNLDAVRNTYALFYHRELTDGVTDGTLASLALDGAFTQDTLLTVFREASSDLDGSNGCHGLFGDTELLPGVFATAYGMTPISEQLTHLLSEDKAVFTAKYEALRSLFLDNEVVCRHTFESLDHLVMFNYQPLLFAALPLSSASASSLTEVYGVLPLPKYDEEQSAYASPLLSDFDVLVIPGTTDLTHGVPAIIEAMQMLSSSLDPVEVLGLDATIDATDEALLSLIMETRTSDRALIFRPVANTSVSVTDRSAWVNAVPLFASALSKDMKAEELLMEYEGYQMLIEQTINIWREWIEIPTW